MSWKTLLAAACMTVASSAPLGAAVLYSSDFGAGYVNGELAGQNGWLTFQPATTPQASGFVVSDGVVVATSGIDASTSPRYAWQDYAAAGAAAIAAGETELQTAVRMYVQSGTSTARIGLLNYDTTGRVLAGFTVQQDTGALTMLGFFDNAGTTGVYSFPTGETITRDAWHDFLVTWDHASGRFTLSWDEDPGFYVDGAAAGATPGETDFYLTRNGSTTPAVARFDDLLVVAVPEPSLLGLGTLALGGVALRRRRA